MDQYDELLDAVRDARAKFPRPIKEAETRTPLAPDAPAPRFNGLLAERGAEAAH